MTKSFANISAPLVAVAIVSGVIGHGVTEARAGSAGGIRCEIQVSERRGGVSLEGIVYAKSEVDGTYRLRVTQSSGDGSSNINQSGDFSAGPGDPQHLGTVSLGGNGPYTARLEVSSSAGHASCSERVGGSL